MDRGNASGIGAEGVSPLTYVPALDGLRALAAIVVVLFHAKVPGFRGGHLGVDVFFVLSGYLITALLVREHQSGGIDIRLFYRRRLKRLYPALLLMLSVYVLVAPYLWPAKSSHLSGATAAALYLLDYFPLYEPADYVHHTWSLAAEAHFYLIWPFVITWALTRMTLQQFRRAMFWLAVVGTLWTTFNQFAGLNAYNRMDVRLGQLAWGAWLAAAQLTSFQWIPTTSRKGAALAGLAAIAYLVALGIPNPWKMTVAAPLTAIAAVSVIQGAQSVAILGHPVLIWMGTMSYGIYLWHYPIVLYALKAMPRIYVAPVTLALSILAAAASYYTVEAMFRRKINPLRLKASGQPASSA